MGVRYQVQDPKRLAALFGNDTQRIGAAINAGDIDLVSGTLAGMYIKDMRNAQMAQQNAMPTIAQQVFAPPAPPAPPMGGMPPAPPMGAPPMGGMPPAPPMGDMPPAQMGMADGGLAALPIPDSMFDEPQDSGYANGGIVSFADAGLTSAPDYSVLQQMMTDYGNEDKGRAEYEALYQPKREASDRFRQFYADALSEESQKKRRNENNYLAFAKGFFTMAGTPGSLLQSASAGAKAALPDLQEASKERRAEVRDALKQLAADEGMTNAEQREFAKYMMGRKDKRADIGKDLAQLQSADARARAQNESAERISGADNAARLAAARLSDAGEKAPGFSEQAVAAAFRRKLANNARLPVAKTAKEFSANPGVYQKSRETILDEAFAEVMTRSAAGQSTTGLTPKQIRAANVQGGRTGGGQPAGDRIAFESLE